MTTSSHLYSCLISNRPSDGFFGSENTDIDGFTIGSHEKWSQRDWRSATERSERAHRLVKAAKCPTGHAEASEPLKIAGIDTTKGKIKALEKMTRYAEQRNRDKFEEVAREAGYQNGLGVLWHLYNETNPADQVPDNLKNDFGHEITHDPSRTDTHQVDLTTGEAVRIRENITAAGTYAVFEKRDWADEYRVRTKTVTPICGLPPEQAGPRYTKMLSMDGARAITDSCHFVASDKQRRGFSTFLTLTLDSAARCRVENRVNHGPCTEFEYRGGRPVPTVTRLSGESVSYVLCSANWLGGLSEFCLIDMVGESFDQTFHTVQRETSRFLDAAQKMYQRGWVHTYQNKNGTEDKKGGSLTGEQYRGEPHDDKLDYIWVVENPKNEKGQDNPHIHLMMRWRVPFKQFGAWAERIERVWGQGMAHLEKIKEPEKAGSYMAKAAGYLTKGQGATDQGIVRGNRYGISKSARAPGWSVVGIYENGILGSMVRDVYEHFTYQYGDKMAQREYLKKRLEETEKTELAAPERKRIGNALEKIRAELNGPEVPHRPSKYQIVVKGVHRFAEFCHWLKGKMAPAWLPKPVVTWSENQKPIGNWLNEYRRRMWCRQSDWVKGEGPGYWHALKTGLIPSWADDHDHMTAFDFTLA